MDDVRKILEIFIIPCDKIVFIHYLNYILHLMGFINGIFRKMPAITTNYITDTIVSTTFFPVWFFFSGFTSLNTQRSTKLFLCHANTRFIMFKRSGKGAAFYTAWIIILSLHFASFRLCCAKWLFQTISAFVLCVR